MSNLITTQAIQIIPIIDRISIPNATSDHCIIITSLWNEVKRLGKCFSYIYRQFWEETLISKSGYCQEWQIIKKGNDG